MITVRRTEQIQRNFTEFHIYQDFIAELWKRMSKTLMLFWTDAQIFKTIEEDEVITS
jgi:hypothetical protein